MIGLLFQRFPGGKGANHRLMPEDLNQFEREFSNAGVLVLQNEIPHETNLAACGKAMHSPCQGVESLSFRTMQQF